MDEVVVVRCRLLSYDSGESMDGDAARFFKGDYVRKKGDEREECIFVFFLPLLHLNLKEQVTSRQRDERHEAYVYLRARDSGL